MSSFGFLILSSAVFLKNKNNSPWKFILFFSLSTVIISNYTFGKAKDATESYLNTFSERLDHPLVVSENHQVIERVVKDDSEKNNYAELKSWLDKNTNSKSTFLDFSNSPVLYYYCDRILPGYLCQMPHTAHNEYLQRRLLADLKNYDIPAVVFSNDPVTFWDALDGIPNQLRHYRIAEYIYRNYKPAYTISNHSIWIRKDSTVKTGSALVSAFIMNDSTGYPFASFQNPAGKKIYFSAELFSENESAGYLKTYSGKINTSNEFSLKAGLNKIFIPLNIAPASDARLEINSSVRVIRDCGIYSCNEYPDRISSSVADYRLDYIPLIWGSYDHLFSEKKIETQQVISSSELTVKADKELRINFIPVKDKEYGNYIYLRIKNNTGIKTNVILNYGEEEQKHGSFNFMLKEDTEYHDYLIRVSAQYNWYSEDNSWVTFYPVMTDINISKAEILKGD